MSVSADRPCYGETKGVRLLTYSLSCRSAAIYAYDVITRGGSPFLSNKRVFAVPISGVATGIKCDEEGRVYAGCADGVEIWSAGGILQTVIEIPGESGPFRSNFTDDDFTLTSG